MQKGNIQQVNKNFKENKGKYIKFACNINPREFAIMAEAIDYIGKNKGQNISRGGSLGARGRRIIQKELIARGSDNISRSEIKRLYNLKNFRVQMRQYNGLYISYNVDDILKVIIDLIHDDCMKGKLSLLKKRCDIIKKNTKKRNCREALFFEQYNALKVLQRKYPSQISNKAENTIAELDKIIVSCE